MSTPEGARISATGAASSRGRSGMISPATPAGGAVHGQALQAVLQEGVVIAHEHEARLERAFAAGELVENPGQRHALVQAFQAGLLHGGAVGHGVGEGHADLDDVRAARVQRGELLPEALAVGEAAGQIGDEGLASGRVGGLYALGEYGHGVIPYIVSVRRAFQAWASYCSMMSISLSPRPERHTSTSLPLGMSAAFSSTQATAWELSSAGMMPSLRLSVWKAFRA